MGGSRRPVAVGQGGEAVVAEDVADVERGEPTTGASWCGPTRSPWRATPDPQSGICRAGYAERDMQRRISWPPFGDRFSGYTVASGI